MMMPFSMLSSREGGAGVIDAVGPDVDRVRIGDGRDRVGFDP